MENIKNRLFVLLFILSPGFCWGQMQFLSPDSTTMISISNITIDDGSHNYTFWKKEIAVKDKLTVVRKRIISQRKNIQVSTKGYDKYLYSMTKITYNKDLEKYKVLMVVDYDSNDMPLDKSELDISNGSWSSIVPNSIIEKEIKEVIKW